MTHASMINDVMKASWNQLTTANVALRSQLGVADMVRSSEQRDLSVRTNDDMRIRNELAACLARESVRKSELHTTRVEVQVYVTATLAHKKVSAQELNSMRGDIPQVNECSE